VFLALKKLAWFKKNTRLAVTIIRTYAISQNILATVARVYDKFTFLVLDL
jgi:hypothetical protein